MPRSVIRLNISPKHLLFGAFVGLGLLLAVLRFLPDGKLHVVFCDVGQGDAIYIRMPNSADMLVDGGPNDQVLTCLGKYMPFYDRTIDLVVLTHPQKDHLQGLLSVLDRYEVKNFVTIPVGHTTEGYKMLTTKLKKQLSTGKISVKYIMTGDMIRFGEVHVHTVWPEKNWLIKSLDLNPQQNESSANNQVIGFLSDKDLNSYSLYLHLKFAEFDLLLTGDGDRQTQMAMEEVKLMSTLAQVEVLKVPHHGSRTGMTEKFLDTIQPQLSIIQVGKNSYGHPTEYTLNQLKRWGRVLRTDLDGDIEVAADGYRWRINP